MTIIKIDDKEYEFDTLSEEAKDHLQSVKFVDAEIARYQAHIAVMQTARVAYAKALNAALVPESNYLDGDTIKLS